MSRLLGHRGTFLLMFGVVWLCIGAGIHAVAPSPTQAQGLQYLTAAFGGYQRLGWAWVVCGLVSCGYAFTPQFRDRWGFYALMLPTIVWAGSYLAAAILNGRALFVLAALVYTALSIAVGSSAAWPEASERRP